MTGQNSLLINGCRLWEQVSAKGNRYLTGRLGGLKVVILPNTRPVDGDTSTHTLFFGEAPQRPRDAPQRADEGPKTEERQAAPDGASPAPGARSARGKVEMPVGDEVPF